MKILHSFPYNNKYLIKFLYQNSIEKASESINESFVTAQAELFKKYSNKLKELNNQSSMKDKDKKLFIKLFEALMEDVPEVVKSLEGSPYKATGSKFENNLKKIQEAYEKKYKASGGTKNFDNLEQGNESYSERVDAITKDLKKAEGELNSINTYEGVINFKFNRIKDLNSDIESLKEDIQKFVVITSTDKSTNFLLKNDVLKLKTELLKLKINALKKEIKLNENKNNKDKENYKKQRELLSKAKKEINKEEAALNKRIFDEEYGKTGEQFLKNLYFDTASSYKGPSTAGMDLNISPKKGGGTTFQVGSNGRSFNPSFGETQYKGGVSVGLPTRRGRKFGAGGDITGIHTFNPYGKIKADLGAQIFGATNEYIGVKGEAGISSNTNSIRSIFNSNSNKKEEKNPFVFRAGVGFSTQNNLLGKGIPETTNPDGTVNTRKIGSTDFNFTGKKMLEIGKKDSPFIVDASAQVGMESGKVRTTGETESIRSEEVLRPDDPGYAGSNAPIILDSNGNPLKIIPEGIEREPLDVTNKEKNPYFGAKATVSKPDFVNPSLSAGVRISPKNGVEGRLSLKIPIGGNKKKPTPKNDFF